MAWHTFLNLNPKDEATAKDEKLQNRIMDSVIFYGLLYFFVFAFLVQDRILCLFEPQSHKNEIQTYVELYIDSFISLSFHQYPTVIVVVAPHVLCSNM